MESRVLAEISIDIIRAGGSSMGAVLSLVYYGSCDCDGIILSCDDATRQTGSSQPHCSLAVAFAR